MDVTHFRIDATQTFDYMNLIAPLSWAKIASIRPSTQVSKIPTIDQLGFKEEATQPSAAQNVKQVLQVRDELRAPVSDTRPHLLELYRMLVAPLESVLKPLEAGILL